MHNLEQNLTNFFFHFNYVSLFFVEKIDNYSYVTIEKIYSKNEVLYSKFKQRFAEITK